MRASPISSIITFLQSAQDAKLSIRRLAEIHREKSEVASLAGTGQIVEPTPGPIRLVDVTFRYGGPSSRKILDNINLEIPHGKVTAIVGTSGSGKTTLLKLLLKLYKPSGGNIYIGKDNILDVDTTTWRRQCGVVMQDGFVFADTLAKNISEAASDEPITADRLRKAVDISNLGQLVMNLPNGFSTNLAYNGLTLSGGEKQRLLIARAVYKEPSHLFFDEATSSLDANNEKEILSKLADFYKGRTVLIIAHRLSTVKEADQIIVMDRGRIVERGRHEDLVLSKGHYFTLIKNQLELGE